MTIEIIVALLVAYLLGSIPSSVWIGKAFFKVDVREEGSGNAGATNTIRVLGWKAGVPVLIIDVLKGWLAVSLTLLYDFGFTDPQQLTLFRIGLAAAAVLGHIFPVYIGFRGGKGVATLLGIGIALYPFAVWLVLAVFLLLLILFRIVSLASIFASISFPFFVIFVFTPASSALVWLSIAVGIFVPLTHYSNIKRLLKGKERAFSFRKSSSEK